MSINNNPNYQANKSNIRITNKSKYNIETQTHIGTHSRPNNENISQNIHKNMINTAKCCGLSIEIVNI